MDLIIDDHYPADAAFGADFFTNAAQGELIMEGPDGPVARREKVVVTTQQLDDIAVHWGRICVGERTIRHLAHLFDMVDDWRVKRIIDDNDALRAELVDLSTQLAAERQTIDFLRELEAAPRGEVFFALDGTRHENRRACIEATARLLDVPARIVAEAIPVDEPAPVQS